VEKVQEEMLKQLKAASTLQESEIRQVDLLKSELSSAFT